MPRTATTLLAAALLLSACGVQPGDETQDDAGADTGAAVDTQSAETEEAAVPEPFASLLPWDADAPEVTTTESGLQYRVISEGPEGGVSPTERDTVTVMYEGRLPDGQKFDSSYDRGSPATFPLNGVIRGWTEGLQYMSEGDEFMFYIPTELGYGQNPRPGGVIQPGDDLVFRVALQGVQQAPPPKEVDAEAWATYVPWDSSNEAVKKTGSGLEFVILDSGDQDGASPVNGEVVVVHYEGRLAESGETFDSSFERGEPALFPSDRLIDGWVEGLALMKPGDRWLMYIPAELGYGAAGTPGGPIPPNADLIFEVEMLDVLKVE